MKRQFDHEKLDVYRLLLRVVSWVANLLEEIAGHGGSQTREVRDQLSRASLSSLLNTAEGNGKRAGKARARFFDDARGSSTECAACLDALVAIRCCNAKRIEDGKAMLFRAVSMLTKLVERFSEGDRPSTKESKTEMAKGP